MGIYINVILKIGFLKLSVPTMIAIVMPATIKLLVIVTCTVTIRGPLLDYYIIVRDSKGQLLFTD